MHPAVQPLIKPIFVDNSSRLEDYLKSASTLKSLAKAHYDKSFYIDAAAAYQSYINLVESLRSHNSYKQPAYRSQIFSINSELPKVQVQLKSCLQKINKASSRQAVTIQQVIVPSQLLDSFIAISFENTENDTETLGILAGSLDTTQGQVKALILPKQTGCRDSCECIDDESLYEVLLRRSWAVLGWIHTHPNHDLFLSSVDLHTQAGYQWLLPEAFAVVFAPTHPRQIGTFRLTSSGLRAIRECRLKGFHPHGRECYTEASNVIYIESGEFELIDLR